MKIIHKKIKNPVQSKCECGKVLPYATTPFMTNEKRGCPKCGRIHYVGTPIDWAKANGGNNERKANRRNGENNVW